MAKAKKVKDLNPKGKAKKVKGGGGIQVGQNKGALDRLTQGNVGGAVGRARKGQI